MYRNKAIECYKKIAVLLDKPGIHESFSINEEVAQELVGEWQIVGQPQLVLTFFLKDKRLYSINNEDWQEEIFTLSRNKIMESDMQYATIVRENNQILLKYNSYSLKKVD